MSVKLTNTKFHENPCSGSQLVTWISTEVAKLIGVFLEHFVANAPKITNMATAGIMCIISDIFKVVEIYINWSCAKKRNIKF
jgi:hypothetical protein